MCPTESLPDPGVDRGPDPLGSTHHLCDLDVTPDPESPTGPGSVRAESVETTAGGMGILHKDAPETLSEIEAWRGARTIM